MANKVSDDAIVVWVNDHPDAADGPGFYIIESEKNNDHQNPIFKEKVEWKKDNPEAKDEVNDPTNNEGHWYYIEKESS